MKTRDLDTLMRSREWMHSMKLPPGTWTIVRVDGRSFTTMTEQRGYKKPFDHRMHHAMVMTAGDLLKEFNGVMAYTHSDEISVVLRPDFDLFNRSVEKIVSISAGIASAAFTDVFRQGYEVFDSRVWLGTSATDVVDYMSWRQADAARGALNGYAYWLLRQDGRTARQATKMLHGRDNAFKHELLRMHDINFNKLPRQHRRGALLYWHEYHHTGVDPRTLDEVETTRRRIKPNEELPKGDEFRELIEELLT